MWFYYAIVFVVGAVLAYANIPKPQSTATKGELNVPTAQAGQEIPVVFGTRYISGSSIVWYGDLGTAELRKSGGKK